MMLLIAVWVVLYVVVPLAVGWYARPRVTGAGTDFAANVLSFLLNVFAPYVAETYILQYGLVVCSERADLSITIHVLLTLLACGTIVAWGSVHVLVAMKRGGFSIGRALLLYVGPVLGFLTILAALFRPTWFVDRTAYEAHHLIWWIWPETIDAPITYFRVGLAFATIVGLLAVGRESADAARVEGRV